VNAPVRIAESDAGGDLADFAECCEAHAWFWDEGWISLQIAADNLQYLAERWSLVDEHGQDAIQDCIAGPFAQLRAGTPHDQCMPGPELDSGAADIVRRLEMADPRDRWKRTGEAPPPSEVRNGPMPAAPRSRPLPQSTIDAFLFVVRLDDAEYLKSWIDQHPLDAAALYEIWESKNARA
jgi:hypothetical protein